MNEEDCEGRLCDRRIPVTWKVKFQKIVVAGVDPVQVEKVQFTEIRMVVCKWFLLEV